MGIAMRTSESKVFNFTPSTMFLANHMVYFKTNKGIGLPHFAVFTTIPRAFCNELPNLFREIYFHAANNCLARALARLMSMSSAK